MWTCSSCGRIFEKAKQMHSCRKVPLEQHFVNKPFAKEIYDHLLLKINKRVGRVKEVTLPCCIHLFGTYDFLAALPKKDKLEIRFALDRELKTPRLKTCVAMSSFVYKNCFDVCSKDEVDKEFIDWLKQSYHLKDN